MDGRAVRKLQGFGSSPQEDGVPAAEVWRAVPGAGVGGRESGHGWVQLSCPSDIQQLRELCSLYKHTSDW